MTLARRGTLLVEIADMAFDSDNLGDTTHPSTEVLWDTALMAGARIFGVASDDAHHYDDHLTASQRGEDVFVGNLGWVMVRAHRDPAAIRTAIVATSTPPMACCCHARTPRPRPSTSPPPARLPASTAKVGATAHAR